jgi:hypothetical protein
MPMGIFSLREHSHLTSASSSNTQLQPAVDHQNKVQQSNLEGLPLPRPSTLPLRPLGTRPRPD